jgi:hypothetical protein
MTPPLSPEQLQAVALYDVFVERMRQVSSERWTPEHDDQHYTGDLAKAAACYALRTVGLNDTAHDLWPWDDGWWKPKDRRRDLVRAAALIVAEIERLDRAAAVAQMRGEGKISSNERDRLAGSHYTDDERHFE